MYYEELIKRLRNRRIYIQQLGTLNDYPLLGEAADAIEELSKPKWIPVTSRLPSKNARYLTVSIEPWFGATVVDIMRWSGVWMYDGRETEATVTHWMPLPEPLKAEEEWEK